MGRPTGTDQDRADRHHPGYRLDEIVGDVGGVETGHDEEIGGTVKGRGRHDPPPHLLGQRRVGVHLAVHLELGGERADAGEGLAHLEGGGGVAAAETAVGDQRHLAPAAPVGPGRGDH